jgi:hypothetical protein
MWIFYSILSAFGISTFDLFNVVHEWCKRELDNYGLLITMAHPEEYSLRSEVNLLSTVLDSARIEVHHTK